MANPLLCTSGKSTRHDIPSHFLVLVASHPSLAGRRRALMAGHALDPSLAVGPFAVRGPLLATATSDWCHQLPTLVGVHASLREVTLADAPSLVAHLNTADVRRFIAPPPTTEEAFENFVMWAQCERARGRYACYAVVPHGMSEAAGVFQLRQMESQFSTAEWGFALGAAFWGNGYFTDAARLIVDFAVDVVGVRRLEARSAVENGRGNGALRKIGAVQEGVMRRAFRKDERLVDAALWTILADEWRQTRVLWSRLIVH
jgi:ribosomal-protein-alanine N-acetyltransferase